MNPLRVDYAGRRRSKWAPFALFGAALAFALAMVHDEWQTSAEAGRNSPASNVVGSVSARTGDKSSSAPTPIEEELRRAEQLIGRLSLPWAHLFGALEKAHTEDVALLTLQPDAQRKSLQITGEAKTYPDVLAYVGRLKNQALLESVHLVSTEVQENHPQRPVSFAVSAHWTKAP